MRVEPITLNKLPGEAVQKREQTLPPKEPLKNSPQRPAQEERSGESLNQQLIAAIEQANQTLQIRDRHFRFTIHQATKKIMVQVIDVETEEVIKEIPPEKILDLVARLWELAGIFVDEKR
jgi:flagellar protein FlaG